MQSNRAIQAGEQAHARAARTRARPPHVCTSSDLFIALLLPWPAVGRSLTQEKKRMDRHSGRGGSQQRDIAHSHTSLYRYGSQCDRSAPRGSAFIYLQQIARGGRHTASMQITPPIFLAPSISSRWQSSANIVRVTTCIVAIVSTTSVCAAFTSTSAAVFNNRRVFAPLIQTFTSISDNQDTDNKEVATALSADAAAIDPWVLRSVTFACLDGSPSSPDPQLLADYLMETGCLFYLHYRS